MQLRGYQAVAVDNIRNAFRRGRKRVVLILPTGGGKTVVAAHMIQETARLRGPKERQRRVIVIAHRKELVDQTVAKLERFEVQAGVVMGDDHRFDDFLPVQVCSIQTLSRRMDRLPPADLIVYDEVHHALSESSQKVLAAYPNAYVIGLTATPWRTDKRGLADLFEESVVAATPAELMKLGALVPYDPFAYDAPDLHDVGLVAGEFNQKQLGLACNTDVLVGSVVREYLAHAGGRPGIIFPVDVAHSRTLVQEFTAAGIAAEHLDCETPKAERERIIQGLSDGSVTLVSSVGVLTEGFDAPPAEVCILARPTKSLSLFMQMIGRVLRPSPETGKERALIHDHGGNILRHGFPDDDRDYSLTATPARVRELATCIFCRAVVGQARPDGTCPKCGELIAEPRDPSAPAADAEPGESKRTVDGTRLDRAAIEKLRGKLSAGGVTRELSDEQVVRVSKATREEKAAELLRLKAVAERKGFKPGFAAHQFKECFGHWPRFKDDELEAAQPAAKPFLPLAPRQDAQATSEANRFWSKVTKTESCWHWTAGVDAKTGRGKFRADGPAGPQNVAAPLWAWRQVNGHVPQDMRLTRTCTSATCVRPEHHRIASVSDLRQVASATGNNGGAELDGAAVLDIRTRLSRGETVAEIANSFGVSEVAIRNIRSGKTWAWLATPTSEASNG